jgi:signal transduction histidine kinase
MDGRDYEALLQFLYLIPVGVIKMQPDGTVDFIDLVATEMLQTAIPGISCKNGWEALNQLDSTLQEAALLSGEHLGSIGTERRTILSSDPNHPRYAGISVYRVNALCLMVILADNTKLVLEEQAATAAVRTKREFLASISHEMRTPLNGVMGITDMLLETQLDSEQRNHLNIVKSSGEALLGVINDILDYSKMEVGKLQMDAIPFSLRGVLNNTLQTLSFSAHKKGLELNQTIEPGFPDSLIGDPARVR